MPPVQGQPVPAEQASVLPWAAAKVSAALQAAEVSVASQVAEQAFVPQAAEQAFRKLFFF